MNAPSPSFIATLDAFSDAAIGDHDSWSTALNRLASHCGASFAELLGVRRGELAFIKALKPQAALQEWVDAAGYSPDANPRVALGRSAPAMRVIVDADWEEVRPQLQSDAYMDLNLKHDIPYGCQTTLTEERGLLVGLSILRTHGEGTCTPEIAAAFADVAPHALAAIRSHRALRERGLKDIVSGLEYAQSAAFLCAKDGEVQAMTAAGERVLAAGALVGLESGRLVALTPEDDGLLRAARHAVLADRLSKGGATHLVLGPPGGRVAVHLRALPGRDDWGLPVAPRLLVIVSQRAQPPSAEVLRAAFDLTAAEADIALALARGLPREAIALQRGATLGTVRQQVKTIFAKAGVGREAELIAAVGRLG